MTETANSVFAAYLRGWERTRQDQLRKETALRVEYGRRPWWERLVTCPPPGWRGGWMARLVSRCVGRRVVPAEPVVPVEPAEPVEPPRRWGAAAILGRPGLDGKYVPPEHPVTRGASSQAEALAAWDGRLR